VVFVDVSEDPRTLERRLAASNKILRQIGATGSLVIAANKTDLLNPGSLEKSVETVGKHFPGVNVVCTSAKLGENTDQLLHEIAETLHPSVKVSTASTPSQP
jgi:50S ribosomal subunit-associated GTPase HflX